ncbi:MAG: hypothetical protein HY340_02370 [Candidatus Kerfeldbacteria bacterium]|nr:hypothetical protein [Candidatus Kerfeldbacteria bacterium]
MKRTRVYLASFLCSIGVVGTVVLLYLITFWSSRLSSGFYGPWSGVSIFMLLATALALLVSFFFAGPVYAFYKKQKRIALLMLLLTVAFVFAEALMIVWGLPSPY